MTESTGCRKFYYFQVEALTTEVEGLRGELSALTESVNEQEEGARGELVMRVSSFLQLIPLF